jgi:drug/metabolite transporter (DMT)-like permease
VPDPSIDPATTAPPATGMGGAGAVAAADARADLVARLSLVGAATLFGTTFVVVQDAVEDLTPFGFLALRFLFAAIVSLPFAVRATRGADGDRPGAGPVPAAVTVAAVLTGLVLLAGYAFQTTGLQRTSSSSSAFITGLFVAFTPLLAAAVDRRVPARTTLLGVGVAVVGLFLLTGAGVDAGWGEVLTLGCAISFAFHILLLERYGTRVPVVLFNTIQLLVVGVGCALVAPFTGWGEPTAAALGAAAFTGVVVSAIAFGLQLHGQRRVDPSRSALLLSLEPVFAGILGYVVGDRIGAWGFVGAALMIAGAAYAEIAALRRSR